MIQSQLPNNMSFSSSITTTATATRVPLVSAPTNTCEVFNSNSHSTIFEEEVFKQLQPMQKKSNSNKPDIAAQQQRQTAEIAANYTAYGHNHNHNHNNNHQHHLQSHSIPVTPNQKQHRLSVICKREELSTRLNNNNRSVDSNQSANKDNNNNNNKNSSSNHSHQPANFQLQYQEEFNRMRERLFRLLSKVPIQVESVVDCAAQDSISAAFAATSTGSSSSRSAKKHDREPLLIKYYNDRALGEILEQHFGCSLIKHNYEHGLPLNAHIERNHKLNPSHNLSIQQQQYTCSPANHLISVSNSITDPFASSMMISSSQINQPSSAYEQHHEHQLQVQVQVQQQQQQHQQQLLIQQPKYLNQTSYSEWPSASHSAANMTAYEWQIPTYDLDALKMAFVSERSTANANCSNNRRSTSSTVKDGTLYQRHSANVVPANRRQKQSTLALNRQVTKSLATTGAITATSMSNQSSPSTSLHSSSLYSHNNHLQQQQQQLSQLQVLDSFKQQHPADCKLKYTNQSNNTFVAADIFSDSHLTEIESATATTTTITTTPTTTPTTTTVTTTTNAANSTITTTANNGSTKGTTTSNSNSNNNSTSTSQANSQRSLSYELSHLTHSANNYINNHHHLQQQPVTVTNNLHIYTTTSTPYLPTTELTGGSQQLLDDCQPSLSFTQTTSEHNHSPSASSSTSSSLLHHNNSSSSYCHQHSSSVLPSDNLLIVGASYEQDALEQQQLSESYYQTGGNYLQMHNFIGHPASNDWHLCHTTNVETCEQHSLQQQQQQQHHMIEQQQASTEIQSENYCNRQRNGFYQNQELTSYVVYTTNDCQQTGVGLESGGEAHQ